MKEAWAILKTNRAILIMNMIICGTLTAGYAADVLKGRMPPLRLFIFLAILALELAVCLTIFIRNGSSSMFKYYSLAGYIIVYIYAIFNSDAAFTYVFLFPVTILYVLYYDIKLIVSMGIATTVLNIAKIIYQVNHGHTASDDITSYTVQMAFVILVSIGLYVITKITVSINAEKIAKILDAQRLMEENAAKLYESINEQVQKSENIVEITDEIKTLSENMTKISKILSSNIKSGMDNVRLLNDENAKVNTSNQVVFESIKDLGEFADDITQTIKTISGIALNTNILSLNASVEATRAGEMNKGFMVVADEVGKLAEQSDKSAKQIDDVIKSLSEKTGKTLAELKFMIEQNASQTSVINKVGAVFDGIEREISSLVEKIHVLDSELNQLSDSNRDISTGTQQIAEIASQYNINDENRQM